MSTEEKHLRDFSLLISQLIRSFNLLERDEKVCFGVTIPQCYTIETLAIRGKLSMKELSLEMGVAGSTMTRVLDVMVRDKLVKRDYDTKDRRVVYIKLTNKGKELALKIKQCTEDYVRKILDKVPENNQENIFESLKILLRALERYPSCKHHADDNKKHKV